jgi:uncharacterized protein (DUF169 family)
MIDWYKLCNKLEQLIRPQTHPLAIKLLKNERDFPVLIERPENMGCIIQAINLARRRGLTVGVTSGQFSCGIGLWTFGFAKLKEGIDPFQAHMNYVLDMDYYKDEKAAKEAINQSLRVEAYLEPGKYKAMLITPLSQTKTNPDIILIYGNPAQISRLVAGAIYHNGGVVTSATHSGLSCASEIVIPFLKNQARVIIPGTGERVSAMTQDDEMVFSLPANHFKNLVDGLEKHYKRGIITYPIPFRLLEKPPPSSGPPAAFRDKLEIIT